MELGKRLNPKQIFIGIYFLAFAVYLIIGLQPVGAANYEIVGELNIPEINLTSDVAKVELNNGNLPTPDTIVGSFSKAKNKTLLFGHESTVFGDLDEVKINDEIIYNGVTYHVDQKETMLKTDISMNKLLKAAEKNTLVIMTCAGTDLGDGDATHRLIITASV